MLSTAETAAMTTPPTTRYTVEREIRRGNLAAEKTGGRWLIEPSEAERWAAGFVKWREQSERHSAPATAQPDPAGRARSAIRNLPPMR
jgi:hypothetical protein